MFARTRLLQGQSRILEGHSDRRRRARYRLLLGIELVKDQGTKETWAGDDAERLLRGYVSPEMFRRD